MTDMKALLRFPGERRIAIADCPIPALMPGTVLVRTEISVISNGTERRQTKQTQGSLLQKAWQRPDLVALTLRKLRRDGLSATLSAVANRLGTPMPTGYANCGIVDAIAPDVTEFKVGQSVACAGLGYANHAQYNTVPRNLVCAVPDMLPPEKAAFTTLYAIALHAVHQGEVTIGHQVAVVGCGIIGQLVTQTAMVAGALATSFDPSLTRRNLSQKGGAIETFAKTEHATPDQFDVVFLCADDNGDQKLIENAAGLCRDRGIIVCVGDVAAQSAREPLYRKELTIRQVRSYGPGRYDPNYEERGEDYPIGHARWTIKRNMAAALALMAYGKLDPGPLISQEIALSDAAAFLSRPPIADCIATLIRYDQKGIVALSNRVNTMLSLTPKPTLAPTPPTTTAGAQAKIQTATAEATVTATTFTTVAASPTPSTSPPTNNPVSIGLIGAGNYLGGALLPRFKRHRGVDFRAIASQRGLSALSIARKISGAIAVSDPNEIFTNANINTVVIATCHDSHAELAAKALKSGKHIWLEKPICINRAQIKTLSEIADPCGSQVFMIGHNRRYAPMTAALKAHLPNGPKFYRYQIRIDELAKDHWLQQPRQGGRTIGEISHFVDLICFLNAGMPTNLRCDRIVRDTGDSIWHMDFTDGSRGEVSYLRQPKKRSPKEVLEISAPGFDARLVDWRRLDIKGTSSLRKRNWFAPDKGQNDAIDCFIRAIRDGKHDPRMPGLNAEIALMDMILTAAENG